MLATFADLLDRSIMRTIRRLIAPSPCHLVGGALRDAALGVRSDDIDIVVSEAGRDLATQLAQIHSTRVIELGGDRFAAYRVIAGDSQVDIWDRGATSLQEDLRRRDLTIHSFALDLHSGAIVDPFDGRRDLARHTLRMTTRSCFAEDPLRVLRLCRFVAQLPEFRIDPATGQRASEAAARIGEVASERIRSEIESTLRQSAAGGAIELWIQIGFAPDTILDQPVGADQRRQLDTSMRQASNSVERILNTMPAPADLVTARIALLLRVLESTLDSSGSQMALGLRHKGYLTTLQYRRVARILTTPPPGDQEPDQRWFLHSLGNVWKEALYVAAGTGGLGVRAEGSMSSAAIARLFELAMEHGDEIFVPRPLLSGTDLHQELGIEPGPQMGRILDIVFRRQIEGKVHHRSQALELAGNLWKTS